MIDLLTASESSSDEMAEHDDYARTDAEFAAMLKVSRSREHAAGEHADFVDMDCPTCVAEHAEIGGKA